MAPIRGDRPPHRGGTVVYTSYWEIISYPTLPGSMAKNTFFIRASVNAENGGIFKQEEIDLGSYTNLGSSKPEVLRIHRIIHAMTDAAGEVPVLKTNTATSAAWQLTTQSQTSLVLMTDDSFVSGGRAGLRNPDGADNPPSQAFETAMLPQDLTAGYVIAVPSLFIGGFAGADFDENVYHTLVLECTTEPMSKANAVSLAISQQ